VSEFCSCFVFSISFFFFSEEGGGEGSSEREEESSQPIECTMQVSRIKIWFVKKEFF